MSRRQPHETEAGFVQSRPFPVRACGMEARGLPQHRTQVKPRKAGLSRLACRPTRRPNIQPRQDGNGDGGGGKLFILTPRDLSWSAKR